MHSFVLALNEAEQVVYLRHQMPVGAQDFPGVFQADLGAVEQAVRLGQGLDDLRRKVIAFQSHRIDAAGLGRVALDQHIRRHVVADGAQAGNEAVSGRR